MKVELLTGTDDLWTHPAQWRCITTNTTLKSNGQLIMGGGQALQAAQRYPDVPLRWGKWTSQYGGRVFVDSISHLIAFPTKHDPYFPSTIEVVRTSAQQLAEVMKKRQMEGVLLIRPGMGLGGLSWLQVQPILQDELSDVDVTVLIEGSDFRRTTQSSVSVDQGTKGATV